MLHVLLSCPRCDGIIVGVLLHSGGLGPEAVKQICYFKIYPMRTYQQGGDECVLCPIALAQPQQTNIGRQAQWRGRMDRRPTEGILTPLSFYVGITRI